MEIYQFEQFRAIAECGIMREAAEKLYLSQPTLSHNLKKLEGELGCRLFDRSRGRLHITPYGEVVLAHSEEISQRMSAMVAEIEEVKHREARTVHVGCFSQIVSAFLMPPIAADMPDVRFDVVNCGTDELREGLDGGRFDVLIATEICKGKGLKWSKLYSERAFLNAPVGAPQAGLEEAHAADLASCAFAIESGLAGYSDWYAHILREAGVPESAVSRVDYRQHLKVKDTLPACNLITSFIMEFVRTPETRAIIPIAEGFAKRDVGVIRKADAPEKAESFSEHLRRNAKSFIGGNAFVPFFVYPEARDNLRIVTE